MQWFLFIIIYLFILSKLIMCTYNPAFTFILLIFNWDC